MPIDPTILKPAPDGTPAAKDFYPAALMKCAIGYDILSTVVAYDKTLIGTQAPTTIADFFDLERFPGPRGLHNHPQVAVEWALMADGVPPSEVYQVLGTEKGPEARLRHARPDQGSRSFGGLAAPSRCTFWSAGRSPCLRFGMAASTPRLPDARRRSRSYGTAKSGTWMRGPFRCTATIRKEAEAFITFATDSKRMAEQVAYLAYGPTRRSAEKLIPADVKPHSTDLRHTGGRGHSDRLRNGGPRMTGKCRNHFDAWLRAEPFEYDFNPPTAH